MPGPDALPDSPVADGEFPRSLPAFEPGRLVGGRYRIDMLLARGAMGRVFTAHDVRLERRVALKFFDLGPHSDDVARQRFAREGRTAAGLRHSNILEIFDLGEEDGHPFIVMELVDGRSLGQDLRAGDRPAIEAAVRLFRQVASALAFAHDHNVVHRDLKPDNILVDKRGNARLVDFGLARNLEETAATASGIAVGTPLYMAPEILEGDAPSPASDLFSAGVTFYEWLTGRYPFSKDAPFYAIAHEEALAPGAVRADVPPELGGVILRLLAKRPDDRYESAQEVEQDLERIAAQLAAPDVPVEEALLAWTSSAERTRLKLPFVGRDSEVQALDRLLTAAAAGSGVAAIVRGEAGLGKSRLVEELALRARLRGMTVLVGQARDTGGEAGFQLFVSLLGHWAERLRLRTRADLEALSGCSRPRFRLMLPVVANLLALAPEPPRGREQVFEAMAAFLETIAAERAALVVLEDLHFADPGSIKLLGYLLGDLQRLRVALVATTRPQDETAAALAAAAEGRQVASLTLEPLREPAIRNLADRLLADTDHAAKLAAVVARETQGNPLFIAELLKLLKAEGALVPRGSRYVLAREPEVRELPDTIRAAVERRFHLLSRDEREVAEMAAVWGDDFSASGLVRVVRGDRLDVLRALRELERRHHLIVSEGPSLFRFSHGRVREFLYDRLPPSLRREFHALVAERMAEDEVEADAPALARHFELAGRPREVARWSRVAAAAAHRACAYETALAHYERALAFDGEAERGTVLAALGDIRLELGDLAGARAALDEALAGAGPDPGLRGEIWTNLSKLAEREGDLQRVVGFARNGLEEIGAGGPPAVRSGLLRQMSYGQRELGDLVAARASIEEALAAARASGDELQVAHALYWRARLQPDPELASADFEEVARIAAQHHHGELQVRAVQGQGSLDLTAGDCERAIERMQRALDLAEKGAGPTLRAAVRVNLARAFHMAGRYAEALPTLRAALQFARRAGNRSLLPAALINTVSVRIEMGAPAAACEELAELETFSDLQRSQAAIRTSLRVALDRELGRPAALLDAKVRELIDVDPRSADLHDLLGVVRAADPERAAEAFRRAAELATDAFTKAMALCHLAQALARTGDAAGGRAALELLASNGRGSLTVARELAVAQAGLERLAGSVEGAAERLATAAELTGRQGAALREVEIRLERLALAGPGGGEPAGDRERIVSLVENVARSLVDPAIRAQFLSRHLFQPVRAEIERRLGGT